MTMLFTTKNIVDFVHENDCWPLSRALLKPPELCSHREYRCDHFLCLTVLLVPQQVRSDVKEEAFVFTCHYLQVLVAEGLVALLKSVGEPCAIAFNTDSSTQKTI